MLVGRHPVRQFVSDRFEVTSTAQLFGAEALGHPARHLRDVTKLCSFDEDALDAQGFEFPGRFRTLRRVRRWSCHTERLSAPNPWFEGMIKRPGVRFAAPARAGREAALRSRHWRRLNTPR